MRRLLLLTLFLGPAGLLVGLILEALGSEGGRRLLAVAAGGLAASALLAVVAGNLGLKVAGPGDPGPAMTASGATFLAGLAATAAAAAAALAAGRRRQQPAPAADTPAQAAGGEEASPAPGQAAASGSMAPMVVVRGCAPEAAAALAQELQEVAALLGKRLLVLVCPRQPAGGQAMGECVLLRLPRPRAADALRALQAALGCQPPPGGRPTAGRGQRRQPPPTAAGQPRLRPEDVAAAIGRLGRTPDASP